MTLRKGEYEITDDAITIKKEGGGKADVLTDLLKLFEPLKGE